MQQVTSFAPMDDEIIINLLTRLCGKKAAPSSQRKFTLAVGTVTARTVYCRQHHVFIYKLRNQSLPVTIKGLVARILCVLLISGVGPVGLLCQQDAARLRCRLWSFLVEISAPRPYRSGELSSLDIWICSAALFAQVRQQVVPRNFQPALRHPPYSTTIPDALHSITGAASLTTLH